MTKLSVVDQNIQKQSLPETCPNQKLQEKIISKVFIVHSGLFCTDFAHFLANFISKILLETFFDHLESLLIVSFRFLWIFPGFFLHPFPNILTHFVSFSIFANSEPLCSVN